MADAATSSGGQAGEPPSAPAQIAALLRSISADQKTIITTLLLVLDGFGSQTKLLQQLADLAKDDPGPSPLSEGLDHLTEAVLLLHKGLKGVSDRLDHLPAAILAELDRAGVRVEG